MPHSGEKHSAIYARVSTEEQSVEQQLSRLRPLSPAAAEYVDSGVSGRLDSRPAFDQLRHAILAGAVSEVLVVKLDRLGRSAKTVLEFFDEAEAHGTRVIVVDQQIDTSTPVGRLVRTVLAAMTELEGDLIRERTRDAMRELREGRRATRSGKPVGRPRRVTPALAARVMELRERGSKTGGPLPWKQVAIRAGLPEATCRKVPGALRGKPPCVEKGSDGFRNAATANGATPGPDSGPFGT